MESLLTVFPILIAGERTNPSDHMAGRYTNELWVPRCLCFFLWGGHGFALALLQTATLPVSHCATRSVPQILSRYSSIRKQNEMCFVVLFLGTAKTQDVLFVFFKCFGLQHTFQTQPQAMSVQPGWTVRFRQQNRSAQQSQQPRCGDVSLTMCVSSRWSRATLHDYNWSGLSNLLWSGWSNFGSKGTFFFSTPTLLLSFIDYTMERKKMFLKGFLLSFLRKFKEFNNCWPLANPQAKVFFQLRLHLDPSWQIF